MIAAALVVVALGLLAVAARVARRRRGLPATRVPGGRTPVTRRPVAARRAVRADVPHLLYCYKYGPHSRYAGRVYYGITNDPKERHRRRQTDPRDAEWLAQSDNRMYEIRWLPNRPAALAAERDAIRAGCAAGERLYNTHHVPRKGVRRGTAYRTPSHR